MSDIDNNGLPFFWKIEGCGNKFVVLNNSKDLPSKNILSKLLADPNFGVGTDGLLVVSPALNGERTIEMYNPDGSTMGMCGNGIRCVTRYLFLNDKDIKEKEFKFNVEGRRIVCTTKDNGKTVEVDMGEPSFNPKDIPIDSHTEWIDKKIEGFENNVKLTALSIGNPHGVIFEQHKIEILPKLETHKLFPNRSNIEMVKKISNDTLEVIVWERGAGFTLACGTGACASVIAGAKIGLCKREMNVILPGGEVKVRWDLNNHVYLNGPAREIFSGRLSKSFLERVNL